MVSNPSAPNNPTEPNPDKLDMLSVTIPIYNEAENLPQLYRELKTVLDKCAHPYEIIFVNDGSTDESQSLMETMQADDDHVRVVEFRRNFGQTAAIMAGFDHAKGDIIVAMDGDLQNDPADIPRLIEKLDEGYDLCSGWRHQRKDPLFSKKIVSRMANRLISLLSRVHLHDYGCTLKAYRRQVIEDVRLYGEMHRFIPIYAHWQGAKIVELPVNHRPRVHGKSNYGLERAFKVVLDLIVIAFMDRFLGKPIYLFGGVGILNFVIAFLSVIASVYFKIWGGKDFTETPLPLLAVMTFITGTMCILMGLLAEMLIRIYYQTQKRKNYVVRTPERASPSASPAARD